MCAALLVLRCAGRLEGRGGGHCATCRRGGSTAAQEVEMKGFLQEESLHAWVGRRPAQVRLPVDRRESHYSGEGDREILGRLRSNKMRHFGTQLLRKMSNLANSS